MNILVSCPDTVFRYHHLQNIQCQANMENSEETNNKSKSKSRKRYEIPKTATCNVCGKSFVIFIYSILPVKVNL